MRCMSLVTVSTFSITSSPPTGASRTSPLAHPGERSRWRSTTASLMSSPRRWGTSGTSGTDLSSFLWFRFPPTTMQTLTTCWVNSRKWTWRTSKWFTIKTNQNPTNPGEFCSCDSYFYRLLIIVHTYRDEISVPCSLRCTFFYYNTHNTHNTHNTAL